MRRFLVLGYFYVSLFCFLSVIAYMSVQRFFPSSPNKISLQLAFERNDERKNNVDEQKNKGRNDAFEINKRLVDDLVMKARMTNEALVENDDDPSRELLAGRSVGGSVNGGLGLMNGGLGLMNGGLGSLNGRSRSLNSKSLRIHISREMGSNKFNESRSFASKANTDNSKADADAAEADADNSKANSEALICSRKLNLTAGLKLKSSKNGNSKSLCCADNIFDLRWVTKHET